MRKLRPHRAHFHDVCNTRGQNRNAVRICKWFGAEENLHMYYAVVTQWYLENSYGRIKSAVGSMDDIAGLGEACGNSVRCVESFFKMQS